MKHYIFYYNIFNIFCHFGKKKYRNITFGLIAKYNTLEQFSTVQNYFMLYNKLPILSTVFKHSFGVPLPIGM